MGEVKLTKAQRELLLDLSDCQTGAIYCSERYKPALALVAGGLAAWARVERLTITSAGRLALKGGGDE